MKWPCGFLSVGNFDVLEAAVPPALQGRERGEGCRRCITVT